MRKQLRDEQRKQIKGTSPWARAGKEGVGLPHPRQSKLLAHVA